MSKHLIEINFDELKFNLYELLGVSPSASTNKIKKAYRNLIIKFHPDKNDFYDEEIYNHLTLSNQVLTNDQLRKRYDKWLKSFDVQQSHQSLKEEYNQIANQSKDDKMDHVDSNESFSSIQEKLNKKHGFDPENDLPIDSSKFNKKFNELQNEMRSLGLNTINKEEIRGNEDFNSKFSNRKFDGELEKQIIKVDKNSQIMELNNKEVGNKFLSINNYNLLYSNDGVDTADYASLEQGFNLLPNEKDLKTESSRTKSSFESYKDSYNKEGENLKNNNF